MKIMVINMFVDLAKITIKAGEGGNGSVSFHREKYIAAGGPDGGDGGRGGDIVLKVDDNLATLADFRYRRRYEGASGGDGSAKRSSGKGGKTLEIRVPRGTLIKEADTGRIIKDMSDDNPFIVAKGGRGGWGNSHFATSTRQIPRFAKSGAPGEALEVLLELKLLADVGLLGCPNVGKSTLLSKVSEAKPNIANYHFTTLTPVLGVVSLGEGTSFVMADIPGLIEGASEGVGLGHEFLRHVDRCRLLVHVVDVAGSEGRDPIVDFETINTELAAYNELLSQRPQIVAGNKADIASPSDIVRFKAYIEEKGYEFFEISAATGQGVRELINAVAAKLAALPPVTIYAPEEPPHEDYTARNDREISIEVHDGVYIIEGDWLMRVLRSVDLEDSDSLQYFQRVLRGSGVIAKLEAAGIQEGNTVSIYHLEFDYVK